MAVSFDPPPGKGTLPHDGGSAELTITSTQGGAYIAFLRLKDGGRFRLEGGTIWPWRNRIRITLPPGGIPPGATLTVIVSEVSGGFAVANYQP